MVAHVAGRGDGEMGLRVPQRVGAVHQCNSLGHRLCARTSETDACRCGHRTGGTAIEQLDAELALELVQLGGRRGLGDAVAAGSL